MAAVDLTDNSIWACVICTYENQVAKNLCEMCGSRKPGQKNDNDKGWKCILCTVVNSTDAIACQMCGGPSPVTNDLTGKQLCGSCTTINVANAHSCIVCGQALNNQIIQSDDNGELSMVDMKPKKNNNNSNNSNNNFPQYANPLGGNDNSYNGFNNNLYQPQFNHNFTAPQQQNQSMPPMPPPQQSQQDMSGMGGMFGNFGGMGSWFGNNNYNNNNVKPSKKYKKGKSKRRSVKNKYNMSQNEDNEEIQFKDVREIFKNDANDKDRIKKEEEQVKILNEWYCHVYLRKKQKRKYDRQHIADIISKMIKFIPDEHWEEVAKNKEKHKEEKTDYNACQVCYCEFDEDEGKLIVMEEHCRHAMICASCLKQHLKVKIKDDDITPWVPCAAPDCKAPICCNLLLQFLELKDLYKFAEGFVRKHLARNNNWIRCGTKHCNFGWMILDKSPTKLHKVKCQACNKRQTVCKDPIKSDVGFNELIKSGVLRLCPKCSLPTMKDKGMCNIMDCGKCGIYWNWKTRETGTSSSQLKNRARSNGTLWEPGELAYQQKLQQTDLPEFKKLLERNGIKYNPNYVRGTR